MKDAEWGETVGGVQVRLKADKTQWKVGEMPTFLLDVANRGAVPITYYRSGSLWDQGVIEVDGTWYGFTGPRAAIEYGTKQLPAGQQLDKPFPVAIGPMLKPYLGAKSLADISGMVPRGPELSLGPGKHTVRVAFWTTETPPKARSTAISNPVEIEVLADPAKPAAPEAAGSEGWLAAQVKDLVAALGSKDAKQRDEAEKKLVALAAANTDQLLVKALDDPDPEIRARVAKVLEAPQRGEPDLGWRLTAATEKREWKSGETPRFSAVIRNDGGEKLEFMDSSWELKVDDVWFIVPELAKNNSHELAPGREVRSLPLDLNDRWISKSSTEWKPLVLKPGRHVVRVGLRRGNEAPLVSQAVVIEVLDAGGKRVAPAAAPVTGADKTAGAKPAAAGAEAAKAAEPPWGEAVEGVQVQLGPEKQQVKAGEAPHLSANIRNTGKRDLLLGMRSDRKLAASMEVEVDGLWYISMAEDLKIKVPPKPLGPGIVIEGITVPLDEKEVWTSGGKVLALAVGKHKVRVAFTAGPRGAPDKPPVRAVSNPVEIEVLPADANPAAAAKAAPAEVAAMADKPADAKAAAGAAPSGTAPAAAAVATPTGASAAVAAPARPAAHKAELLRQALAPTTPLDAAKVAEALQDVGNLKVTFMKGPTGPYKRGEQPLKEALPPGVWTVVQQNVLAEPENQRRFPDQPISIYLMTEVVLNRATGGPAPKETVNQLVEWQSRGYVPLHIDLFLAPSEALAKRRDALLAEADAAIRKGLAALAEKFPALRETSDDQGAKHPLSEALKPPSRPGTVQISASRGVLGSAVMEGDSRSEGLVQCHGRAGTAATLRKPRGCAATQVWSVAPRHLPGAGGIRGLHRRRYQGGGCHVANRRGCPRATGGT